MSTGSLPVREDLLALDPDALAALANRGLVKRAAREVEREAPELSAGEGSTVVAEFADGMRTELPAGGLEQGSCSCGATAVCRHVIALILAYQATAGAARSPAGAAPDPAGAAPGSAVRGWSPGEFGDEEVVSRIGARLVAAARRAERAGYSARVRRGTVPVVELPSATVRFLVPGDLGYVHTDARAGVRDDVIALAVWAFRVADELHPGEPECLVDVGGADPGPAGPGTGLEPVLEFAAEVLRHGAVHAGEGLAASVAGHLGRLERAGFRWPLDATAELADQLAGYRERSARYAPEQLADLIAELFARHRAVEAARASAAQPRHRGVEAARASAAQPRQEQDNAQQSGPDQGGAGHGVPDHSDPPQAGRELQAGGAGRHSGGAGLRARVLGSEESAETPLRRVRLDGLGARVTAVDDRRVVEIFHAQAATGVVLVSQREWTSEDDGPALARRRVSGSTVGALAAGVVVTESALRNASRAVRIASSRVARSTVTVGTGAWDRLPPGLLTLDYALLAAEISRLPPRPVRARVRAELVRVLAIAEVGEVRYAPGEQRLTVEIRDRAGTTATVAASHTGVAPGRIDAVLAALSGKHGTPRYVSGSVHRGGTGRGLVVDPYAIVADGPPIVPDLAGPDSEAAQILPPAGERESDPLAAAVGQARAVLAEAAHTGLAHLPGVYPDRLREARQTLALVGLHRVAGALEGVAAVLGPDPGETAVRAWVDAWIRVGMAAELM
ncbi:hypothetical protein ACQP2E_29000 [Actinoplanes sp. CA-015351]|uniref:hypothetical protein n=1 Tax=Actinoplanes sp. CA-015351 TaxID=3239897 RepID=UPI003D97514E